MAVEDISSGWPPPPVSGSGPLVKICGITRAEDGLGALRGGAAFLGLILAPSPRHVGHAKAKVILDEWRREFPDVRAIGVFVNEPIANVRVHMAELGLFAAQLHGDYTHEQVASADFRVLRALSVKGPDEDETIRSWQSQTPVLLDTFAAGKHGGTGKTFDHRLALPAIGRGKVFVAGGLNPDNIEGVLDQFRRAESLPYAVDVSSGLEDYPGVKSAAKVSRFLSAIHSAGSS
jgi:phosphoribosylanthranilate isomerase